MAKFQLWSRSKSNCMGGVTTHVVNYVILLIVVQFANWHQVIFRSEQPWLVGSLTWFYVSLRCYGFGILTSWLGLSFFSDEYLLVALWRGDVIILSFHFIVERGRHVKYPLVSNELETLSPRQHLCRGGFWWGCRFQMDWSWGGDLICSCPRGPPVTLQGGQPLLLRMPSFLLFPSVASQKRHCHHL